LHAASRPRLQCASDCSVVGPQDVARSRTLHQRGQPAAACEKCDSGGRAMAESKKLKFLRDWSHHLALRLRRRGTRYSIHDRYGDCPQLGSPPVNFQTLGQVERWLRKWMDDEIALTDAGRPKRKRSVANMTSKSG